eukprot:Clim_evm4s245 gene=Clim_evmTU4s245
MTTEENKVQKTVFLACASVVTSVGIILVNKAVISTLEFRYIFSLTAVHYASTCAFTYGIAHFKVFDGTVGLPERDRWTMAAMGTASIAFMNLNLQYNSLGVYQMSKLLCIPVIVAITYLRTKQLPSKRLLWSLAVLLTGVGIATVSDVSLNAVGTIFSAAAVASTAQIQIWQGSKQKEHGLDALQITKSVVGPMTLMFATGALLFDTRPGLGHDKRIQDYEFNMETVVLIISSCVLAIAVNLVAFALIGATSAVTYQVVGHAKTILTLLGGFILFPVADGSQSTLAIMVQVIGMALAVVGIVFYTRIKTEEAQASAQALPANGTAHKMKDMTHVTVHSEKSVDFSDSSANENAMGANGYVDHDLDDENDGNETRQLLDAGEAG